MNTHDAGLSILRVGSYPTRKHGGAGLAGCMLASDPRLSTLYCAPIWPGDEQPEPVPPPPEGVDLRFLPFPTPAMPKQWRGDPRTAWRLARRVAAVAGFTARTWAQSRGRRFDLVHLHSPMYAGIAAWAHAKRIPVVLTLHGSEMRHLERSAVLRHLLDPVDAILCVSKTDLPAMQRLFAHKRVALASNGVDTDRFQPADRRKPRIINVGSLRWHKDQAVLLEAFARLPREFRDWELWIVGEGPLRNELQQRVDTLGLNGRVQLPGSLDQPELARALSRSEIFALSSRTEGLPKALLEAMAAGCACVSTDVGDCLNTLAGTGMVVDPGQVEPLTDVLHQLLRSDGLRRELGTAARERVQHYSWQAYRERHMRHYARLVERAA